MGKLNRSGAPPTSNVHSAPAVQATSPGVFGSDSTAALLDPQTSIAQATGKHVCALSSPAEHPESPPAALHGFSLTERLQTPVYEVTFAAHQPQNGGFSMPRPGQHTARGAAQTNSRCTSDAAAGAASACASRVCSWPQAAQAWAFTGRCWRGAAGACPACIVAAPGYSATIPPNGASMRLASKRVQGAAGITAQMLMLLAADPLVLSACCPHIGAGTHC